MANELVLMQCMFFLGTHLLPVTSFTGSTKTYMHPPCYSGESILFYVPLN